MLCLLGIAACLGTILYNSAVKNSDVAGIFNATDTDRPSERVANLLPAKSKRAIYPYSVIPGGVQDREELVASVNRDPVVNAHYSNFKVRLARTIKSEQARYVHVSYRLRDRIYWTAKTVKIPKGEALITDGKEYARTRCGNQISEEPRKPVSAEEPPIEMLEAPMVPKVDTVELETFVDTGWKPRELLPLDPSIPIAGPALITPYTPVKRNDILPRYYHPPRFRLTRRPPIIVPEPATLLLLIAGLTVLIVTKFTWKK